jgi:plastocyanin
MRSLNVFALASLLAVAACGSDSTTAPSGPASSNAVAISDNRFSSPNIQVSPGTTVTWTWASNASQHNVSFGDGTTSGNRGANATFTRTFATAGTFSYFCTLHSGMTGTVTVK